MNNEQFKQFKELFVKTFEDNLNRQRFPDYPNTALLYMLKQHINDLPYSDDFGGFIKAHRQCDVTDNGNHDMVLWNLLNNSPLAETSYKNSLKITLDKSNTTV